MLLLGILTYCGWNLPGIVPLPVHQVVQDLLLWHLVVPGIEAKEKERKEMWRRSMKVQKKRKRRESGSQKKRTNCRTANINVGHHSFLLNKNVSSALLNINVVHRSVFLVFFGNPTLETAFERPTSPSVFCSLARMMRGFFYVDSSISTLAVWPDIEWIFAIRTIYPKIWSHWDRITVAGYFFGVQLSKSDCPFFPLSPFEWDASEFLFADNVVQGEAWDEKGFATSCR